ncbi:MAG: serine kinase of the HPr protein regulates carbohydrate metabolism [Gammaproteobacteria bacterium]|nr:serine kinase of the HPr protein regulates carbohydrate metabolism [Gammaproteobacteria bacterium]
MRGFARPYENDAVVADLFRDPFNERVPALARATLQLLGGRFQFESDSRPLLRLAMTAFGGLPAHRLAAAPPRMRVRLVLGAAGKRRARSEPPQPAMFAGAGFLAGATDSSNFVVVSPREQATLVVVSPRMLRFPYHTRYELLEFAVFTLAARVQGLVPLHAACVGRRGRGVLLMGPSGAGKSTIALQCLLHGLDFLAEDSVFVAPETMLATGLSNFMHVRADSVRWVARAKDVAAIRKSPIIRRRSGVRKFEVDLRRGDFRLAPAPLQIAAVVFLSPQSAGEGPLLVPLRRSTVQGMLTAEQAYAASQPQWPGFVRSVSRLEAFELRRGHHPLEAANALRELLG